MLVRRYSKFAGIWFGTRGSEVQILSPLTIYFQLLTAAAGAPKPTTLVLHQVLLACRPYEYCTVLFRASAMTSTKSTTAM